MNNIFLPNNFSLDEELFKIFLENNPFLEDARLNAKNLTDDEIKDAAVFHNPLINSTLLPYKEEFMGEYEWMIESPITNFNYPGGYKAFEKKEVLEKFPPKKEGFVESNVYHLLRVKGELQKLFEMMQEKGIPLPEPFIIVSFDDKLRFSDHDHSVVLIINTHQDKVIFKFDLMWGICFDHAIKILRVKKIL